MNDVRPIFIAGAPRSGTTLLSAVLHAHPRVAVAPETRFLMSIYEHRAEFGDLRIEANRLRLARRITRPSTRFPDLRIDRGEVIDRIVAGPPTLGSAAGTVWREFARSRGKHRWGEKRPKYAQHMDVVLRLFPNAQVVHVSRDGRGCVASLKNVEWWDSDVPGAMVTWLAAERELERIGRRLPADSYHRIRYEALINEPDRTLRRLCDFLGEPFDSAMLDRAAAASDIVPARKHWHALAGSEFDRSRATAWQQGLTPDELALFEAAAGRVLRRGGYELRADHRPPPLALARLGARAAYRRTKLTRLRAEDAVARRRNPVPLADEGS